MTSDKEKKSTCKKPQRPQIPYKKLKQTQKARISRWMFEAVCKYYKEHQQMPPEECLESMCRELYPKLHGTAPKASFEDLLAVFRKKQAHFGKKDGSRKTCHKTCKAAGKEEKAESAARAPERSS